MYRTVYYLGLVVAVFSLLGIIVPHSLSTLMFLLPSGISAIVSIILASVLMYFAVTSYLRKHSYKLAFGICGALLTVIAVIGILHSTYYGLLGGYLRTANATMFLLAGIGYMLAGAEYNRPSLAEEMGFDKLSKLYRQYTWKLILGLKLPEQKTDNLSKHISKAH